MDNKFILACSAVLAIHVSEQVGTCTNTYSFNFFPFNIHIRVGIILGMYMYM